MLVQKTMAELAEMLKNGETTSRKITEAYITEIEAKDAEINSFVHKSYDVAREMADASDARRANGAEFGKLDGIPVNLKDVVCSVEAPTTAASKMLQGFKSPYDATVWKRMKNAGMVLLGKVNTDEFTMGSSTGTSFYGITKNPHDLAYVSGGSSGGSAASVAANLSAASIGTDTGGSIRQPAHFCGITGLKPTYGRVSRFGMIPMASSLDCPGPMAKTAEDCALLLEVIAGKDEYDATSLPDEVPKYSEMIKKEIRGMRIGIPKEYFENLNDETRGILESAKQVLTDMGAVFTEISLPHTKYAPAVYYVLAPSEISANMSRYDGVRFGHKSEKATNLEEMYTFSRGEGLGDEVKRRIMTGTYALSAGYYDAYYKKAQKVRTLIKNDFDEVFKTVDVILSPVSPSSAFKIGEKTGNPLEMYQEDIFTIPSNLAGLPGIALPFGKSENGMPLGIQLLAPQLSEGILLQVGHQMQAFMKK